MWPFKKKGEQMTVKLLTMEEMRQKWSEAVCPFCDRQHIVVGDRALPDRAISWDDGNIKAKVYAAHCQHCGFSFNISPHAGGFDPPDEEELPDEVA